MVLVDFEHNVTCYHDTLTAYQVSHLPHLRPNDERPSFVGILFAIVYPKA